MRVEMLRELRRRYIIHWAWMPGEVASPRKSEARNDACSVQRVLRLEHRYEPCVRYYADVNAMLSHECPLWRYLIWDVYRGLREWARLGEIVSQKLFGHYA